MSLLIRENKLECLVAIKHFHPSRAILAKRGQRQSLPKCGSMWCHAWTKYCKYLWEKRSSLFSVIADDEEEKKFYNIENRKPSIKCWIWTFSYFFLYNFQLYSSSSRNKSFDTLPSFMLHQETNKINIQKYHHPCVRFIHIE